MQDFNAFAQFPPVFFSITLVWSLVWKGLALWYAARLNQRNWFIALLILNTAGIAEILYLFVFSKKKITIKQLKFWERH